MEILPYGLVGCFVLSVYVVAETAKTGRGIVRLRAVRLVLVSYGDLDGYAHLDSLILIGTTPGCLCKQRLACSCSSLLLAIPFLQLLRAFFGGCRLTEKESRGKVAAHGSNEDVVEGSLV